MEKELKHYITIERVIIVILIACFFLIPRYENIRDYVENNPQGSNSDYALVKYNIASPEGGHLITYHGYVDNLGVCQYTLDDLKAKGSVIEGRYECERLN